MLRLPDGPDWKKMDSRISCARRVEIPKAMEHGLGMLRHSINWTA